MQSVYGMYGLLIIASATHAWNYYELIGLTGNVNILAIVRFFKVIYKTRLKHGYFFYRWLLVFCRDCEPSWCLGSAISGIAVQTLLNASQCGRDGEV